MKKFLIAAFLLVPLFSFAQLRVGVGAGYLGAIGGFSDTHGSGFNVSAVGEYEFAMVSVIGELGYNSFSAKDDLNVPVPDVDGISFTAGVRAYLNQKLYFETQAGYYFSDFGDAAWIVSAGYQLEKIDFNAGINILTPYQFFNVGVAYRLFSK